MGTAAEELSSWWVFKKSCLHPVVAQWKQSVLNLQIGVRV